MAGLSVRPALPQPPAHPHLVHSASFSDSPTNPASATSYSRPLPDPRVAPGSVNGPSQWRHSSPYPIQPASASVNGYPAGPSNEYGHVSVGEFGATAYPGAGPYQQSVGHRGQWPDEGHHASYSDVGHQTDYGVPPPPNSEYSHLMNQHRYSTGSPLPPPSEYGAPPVASYHQPPPLPLPPQPPIPPPTPLEFERQVQGSMALSQPPQHSLGRSQSVASVVSAAYPAYHQAGPGSAGPAPQFASAAYAPAPTQSPYHAPPPSHSPYNAPPPAQSPYNALPATHAYSPAPPPQAPTYNPYATAAPQQPGPPLHNGASPVNYNAGYSSVNSYFASDYGQPPAAHVHPNGAYREPSPVPPPHGQGNYLRQQYDLNVAQQQQGMGQSQGAYGGPPAPPPRPDGGYPYGYQ